MSTLWTRMALVIAAGTLALQAGEASAQGNNCQWYGTTAVKQQQENERLKCGLKGPEWGSDLKAHLAWCGSVAPAVAQQTAKKREHDLAACAAKAGK